ncbi:hypothetical protein GUITHDRAFT_114482 [Guillardia theta CCMP2712]|uniref:Uncharacterized protein n=1 Tax=Guillardia theta (strain CCMP2712) TaxID=905079 RepID=L1ITC1_GUITC|nr:hypothetical protein GUITHDRAFT_114482 [Guillardia theta CCMP2712]EKX39516.1 hypothetical protein GUITHDRAFT_114482 [Guillardia theta CCMP2712]|eukprot:XP_005826496.1 hypothetical protein GUITHDRAFT_114482 [Guillardia theta CCMP2712]
MTRGSLFPTRTSNFCKGEALRCLHGWNLTISSGADILQRAQKELEKEKRTVASINSALSYSHAANHAEKKRPHASITDTIIENAKRIEEKASALAGKRRARPAGLTLAHKVSAELQQRIVSHPSRSTKTPFAKDRGWSVDKEKADMDSFYDNLDNHAAVKELEARRKNTRDAILHETVLKTKSELKMIQHDAAKKAGGEDRKDLKVESKTSKNSEVSASHDMSRNKFSSSTARSDIDGFYDDLIQHVTAGKDGKSKMSDAAARMQEKKFFSKLRGKSKFAVQDSINVHLSSDAAREEMNSFFENEISTAEHENPLSARKEAKGSLTAGKAKAEVNEGPKDVLEKIKVANGKEAAKSRLEKKFKQQANTAAKK